MSHIKHQTKKELRQLPLILCKLIGGITAVLGFTSVVLISTRKSNASSGDQILPLLATLAGIAVFLLSNRMLARYSIDINRATQTAEKTRLSILSWILLLVLAAIFLAWVYFMTR